MKTLFFKLSIFLLCLCVLSCTNVNKQKSVEITKALIAPTSKLPAYKDMVKINGGAYDMGSDDSAFRDAMPIHKVAIGDFWMDEHEVTNEEFAEFVSATGYQTIAEMPLNQSDYPGIDPDDLVPGSAVFAPPDRPADLDNPQGWWKYIAGASWKHPLGPQTDLKDKDSFPVVQICYIDASAYAKWCGKRLPTEAEWEYAARSGNKKSTYYWGDELHPNGQWMANNYQGNFPNQDVASDGYAGLAPVKMFPSKKRKGFGKQIGY